MNKAEYIKQLKRLIKKYHPDLCNDSHTESIYNEITVKLVKKLNEIKNSENRDVKNKIKEQDYECYKLGIKYYKNIHPNQFYKRNLDTTFETKTYKELVSVLNRIYTSFGLSEHYFKKVINEYPQSPYFEDAKTKIQQLKKIYKSYQNINIEENKIINNEIFMKKMRLKIL